MRSLWGGSGSVKTWELVSGHPSAPPAESNPLLVGLPLDPDYSVPRYCSPSSPSNVCLSANKKCDKCCGLLRGCPGEGEGLVLKKSSPHTYSLPYSSSEKTLEYTFHWSRTPEAETLEPAAPENTATVEARRPGRDSGPQSHGSPPLPSSDSPEHCNDQDLPKRNPSNTKVIPTWNTSSRNTTIYCCRVWGGGCGSRVLRENPTPCVQHPEQRPVLSRPVLKMDGIGVRLCVLMSVTVSGCDCLCVCGCGCVSKMGVGVRPGSCESACMAVSLVVSACVWLFR